MFKLLLRVLKLYFFKRNESYFKKNRSINWYMCKKLTVKRLGHPNI